tara:strand:- start:19429 stop:20901 length:1473 start_codon:yes stop_codon:yes gene_type:complete
MNKKKAAIFLPYTSMSPPMELTICHARRLKNEYELFSIEYGNYLISSQFNLTRSIFCHFYTLARQNFFHSYVDVDKKLYLNKNLISLTKNYENIEQSKFQNGTMSSLASRFRITNEKDLSKYWLRKKRSLLLDSRSIYKAIRILINQNEIDLLCTFNGRFFDSSSVVHAAKDSGIDYLVYDVNRSRSQYYFYNCSLHDIKANQKKAFSFFDSDNKTQLKIGNEYFQKRRFGKRTYEKSYTKGQEINYLPEKINKQKVIAFYPSSDDEYRFLGESFGMKCLNQSEEIRIFSECILDSKDKREIVIRMHPNMATMPSSELEKYLSLSRYPNITVLEPLEKTDTYALLDHAEVVIGFCSSIIIESAYYKKNTFLIGPSPYLGLNLGNEFKTCKAAANFLIKKKSFIKPDKNNALMWAVYINLYNDKLDDFSLVNTYPLVRGERVPTLVFWRLLAGLEKLYYELFKSNNTDIKLIYKLRFVFKRFNAVLKNKWY